MSQVDTSEEGSGEVTATAESPSGAKEDLDVSKVDDNTHHVSFTPSEKGECRVTRRLLRRRRLSKCDPAALT